MLKNFLCVLLLVIHSSYAAEIKVKHNDDTAVDISEKLKLGTSPESKSIKTLEGYLKDSRKSDTVESSWSYKILDDNTIDTSSSNHTNDVTWRLVGGSSSREGRVEVFYSGEWGTVCDDSFNINAARMICRQLGFDDASQAYPRAYFGSGRGRIWLDQLNCSPNASSVEDCSHNSWGRHDCQHSEDAGVRCGSPSTWNTAAPWPEDDWPVMTDQPETTDWPEDDFTESPATPSSNYTDDITDDVTWRLVAGGSSYQGRVEVFYSGEWGTVCDDSFNINAARMICRQLGFDDASQAYSSAYFGSGQGRIWLDQLNCSPNASSLEDCSHNSWGQHNCRHSEDAGVRCQYGTRPERPETTDRPNWTTESHRPIVTPSPNQTDDVTWRLVAGGSSYQGRVEVFYSGEWGTVCDDLFNINAARMICRQLGFDDASHAYSRAYFGSGRGRIWLDDLNCSPNASSVEDCSHKSWGQHNCGHSEDAGVRCMNGTRPERPETTDRPNWTTMRAQPVMTTQQPNVTSHNMTWRLVGGQSRNKGRVEVFIDGEWGTVCDQRFGIDEANMLCSELGFRYAHAAYFGGVPFGIGYGPILTIRGCSAGGRHGPVFVEDCDWTWGRGLTQCDHGNDAGLWCKA